MTFQAMNRHGGILNAYYYMKEVDLKRLHVVRVQLQHILEKEKLWRQYKDLWLPGVKGEGKDEEVYEGSENTVITITIDTHHYASV